MSTALKDFDDVKRELQRLLGQSGPAQSAIGPDALTLNVNGHAVSLCHFPNVRADRAFLCCDCGELSEDEELRVLRRLSDLNFAMYRGNASVFARDPFNGHVVLLGELPFAGATAEAVLETVKRYGEAVARFKSDRYAATPAAAAPPSALFGAQLV